MVTAWAFSTLDHLLISRKNEASKHGHTTYIARWSSTSSQISSANLAIALLGLRSCDMLCKCLPEFPKSRKLRGAEGEVAILRWYTLTRPSSRS